MNYKQLENKIKMPIRYMQKHFKKYSQGFNPKLVLWQFYSKRTRKYGYYYSALSQEQQLKYTQMIITNKLIKKPK